MDWNLTTDPKAWNGSDGALVFVPKEKGIENLSFLEKELQTRFRSHTKRFSPSSRYVFDASPTQRVVLFRVGRNLSSFSRLELARKAISPLLAIEAKKVLVDLRGIEESAGFVDAIVSAWVVQTYELPKYGKEPKKKTAGTLTLLVSKTKDLEKIARNSCALSEGTNLVRRLSIMAGNDLTTTRYVELATVLSKEAGLKTEFFSLEKLKKMGAGAFLAVAQGSKDKGAGILKISYTPKNAKRSVSFVGKGITYDTGGSNLKPGEYMFGMNGDMAGSAVALALILYYAKQEIPLNVTSFLAITDNILSRDAYRPNDVVTSLSKKTIEVIDTDAEGRMVLADTLFLAAEEKPDLLVDFATLTGSCVKAIGHGFSGGYSNTRKLFSKIRRAGVKSGERVWPFPNDADFGRCLKSKVADIKQCRLRGGVDHIEASYFLRQFVDKKVAYVHIDLSAMHGEQEDLAHVSGNERGFGVRFAAQLVKEVEGVS